jgi:hypothetical protein
MTEPNVPGPSSDPPIVTPTGGRAERVSTLVRYLETNRGRFTEDALMQAARAAGYPDDVLDEARARTRASAGVAPVGQRVRRWILVAYLLTFALLTAGMFGSESARRYGGAFIGSIILAATLGVTLLVSLWWLRRQGGRIDPSAAGLAGLLSLPLLLLVIVAGSCLATGLPIPRPS